MENILNRIKLLMEYDTSKTLSENILIVEIVSTADDLLRGLKILGNAGVADDIFKRAGIQSVDTAGNVVAINTLDDFVKFGRNMSPANLGKVQSNLLKSTLPIADKAKYIENYVAQNIKKGFGKGMNATQISDDLVKRGFPKDVADDIANKMTSHYSGVNLIGTTPQKSTGAGVINKTITASNKKSTFKNWIKNFGSWNSMSRTQKILTIVGSGLGVYLLWRYFKDEEPGVFNDCVLSHMNNEDLTKMAQINFGEGIIITNVPNKQLAAMGGIKLFTNGKLESVNGGIKGTWSSEGGSISVTIGGQTLNIPCGKETIPDTDDGSVDPGTSRYRDCGSGPFSKGCYERDPNGSIHRVQSCLGITSDGKFWNVTESALMYKTGKKSFTKDEVNTICGGSNTTTSNVEPNAVKVELDIGSNEASDTSAP